MRGVQHPQDVVVEKVDTLRRRLLAWYDACGRTLPWRVSPAARSAGVRPDPYRIWLSEIMLQQTTTAAVAPYFEAFVRRWPNVAALAAAPRDDVLAAWAGLGYYSRARNLHDAAQSLAAHGFPGDEAGWRALPGVGPYTAAAVAAIAFDQPATVVDANVERVVARLFAVTETLPAARPALRELARKIAAPERPGDWAQAVMDLGATVCAPRAPACVVCPISAHCAGFAAGSAADLPRKAVKPPRPTRHGVAFALTRRGAVLLVQRPDEGLLGGMRALPSTPWRDAPWPPAEAAALAPAHVDWRPMGAVRHVFTHFALELAVWAGEAGVAGPCVEGRWVDREALAGAGLPTVFAKAAARAWPD